MSETKILNGNEIIVRGALEAGFSLLTGYPGSPLADYFNILYKQRDELRKKGIKVAIANSEANAAAMASGAKLAGRDVLVAMKSMGLHVASDALSVGNFSNPSPNSLSQPNVKSAVVIVVGDDPWSMSTSTPADSRYLFKHLHIPFLEPSNPEELKNWIKVAKDLSINSSLYIGVLLNTFLAEGGGRVTLGEISDVKIGPELYDPENFDLSSHVMVPPNSLIADKKMIKTRFPKIEEELKKINLNQIIGVTKSKIGFISSGSTYELLKEVIESHKLLDDKEVSIFKLACSYPLVGDDLLEWLKSKDDLIVVEEKRGFLESELNSFIVSHNLNIKVWGKQFCKNEGFPTYGGLTYEIVEEKLKSLPMFNFSINKAELISIENSVRRLPTFCPGCPHRETLSVLKDLRKWLLKKDIKLISHGDVGCYSLSFLPPFKEMHDLSAMGQGGALSAGMDIFSKNPSVVLMGDSTFFHSGITDISNSVQVDHNITYIILDNDNTAMTGHQMTPRSGISVDGTVRPRQSLINTVKSLGVQTAIEIHPSDRNAYFSLMQDYINKPGVKVIVSNKECGLTFHGKRKSTERELIKDGNVIKSKTVFHINTDSCEDCRHCVEFTGCPGLTKVFDAYGSKVGIDQNICVGDSYCTTLEACPSFEKIIINNYHPTKFKNNLNSNNDNDIDEVIESPVSKVSFNEIAKGKEFRIVITGVGGSGITTISRIIAEAAKNMEGREDIDFKFFDQKGLAQRNGNVTSHISLFQKGKSTSPITPNGKADVLLSPDLLDVCHHLSFLKKNGFCAVDENFQYSLGLMSSTKEVLNNPDYSKHLIHDIKSKIGNSFHSFPLKDISNNYFGKSVYANSILLGILFQSGNIPFSEQSMNEAFIKTLREEELKNNLYSFRLGRRLFIDGNDIYVESGQSFDSSLLVENITDSYTLSNNKNKAIKKFHEINSFLIDLFPSYNHNHLKQFSHDIVLYNYSQNISELKKTLRLIKKNELNDDCERLALRILIKSFFIKDEIFIASILSNSKSQSLRNTQFESLGESFSTHFINKPHIDLFGLVSFELNMSPKVWMFNIVKRCRFIRLMPTWHQKEKRIKNEIRKELVDLINSKNKDSITLNKLESLNNLKGYRDVLYEKHLSHIS